VAAAHVEQPPAGDVLAHEVQEPRGGGAPPGLLAEVLLVGHVAVEVDELPAAGQRRLLDRAAVRAGEEVAVPARLVLGRREGGGGDRRRVSRHGRAKIAEADAARLVDGHGHGLCI
jgi:hypothetical protein